MNTHIHSTMNLHIRTRCMTTKIWCDISSMKRLIEFCLSDLHSNFYIHRLDTLIARPGDYLCVIQRKENICPRFLICPYFFIFLGKHLLSDRNSYEIFIQSKHLKGQLWPRVCNEICNVFAYSCPAPLPGQLWPRVCDGILNVFFGKRIIRNIQNKYEKKSTWFLMVPGWFFMVFLQNVPAPNCILARRSSLGPPPGGRHRT